MRFWGSDDGVRWGSFGVAFVLVLLRIVHWKCIGDSCGHAWSPPPNEETFRELRADIGRRFGARYLCSFSARKIFKQVSAEIFRLKRLLIRCDPVAFALFIGCFMQKDGRMPNARRSVLTKNMFDRTTR